PPHARRITTNSVLQLRLSKQERARGEMGDSAAMCAAKIQRSERPKWVKIGLAAMSPPMSGLPEIGRSRHRYSITFVGKRELRDPYVRSRQPRTFGRKRPSAWLLSEVRGVGIASVSLGGMP